MSNYSWRWSLGAFCALGLVISITEAADPKVDLKKLPPPAAKTGLVYDKDIKPILEKSCLKCHSGDRPKSKYRMDSVATLIKGGVSGEAAVQPGSSEKSPLIQYASDAVQDMEMPPLDNRDKYPPLTKEQIGILRAWIDQGAK